MTDRDPPDVPPDEPEESFEVSESGRPLPPVEVQEVQGSPRFEPAVSKDTPYHRETTAKWLGIGVFGAFAAIVASLCIAEAATLWVLAEQFPKELDKPTIDDWFKWRAQIVESVSNFAQIAISLVAGPLGVVLGFYFRDHTSR